MAKYFKTRQLYTIMHKRHAANHFFKRAPNLSLYVNFSANNTFSIRKIVIIYNKWILMWRNHKRFQKFIYLIFYILMWWWSILELCRCSQNWTFRFIFITCVLYQFWYGRNKVTRVLALSFWFACITNITTKNCFSFGKIISIFWSTMYILVHVTHSIQEKTYNFTFRVISSMRASFEKTTKFSSYWSHKL